MSKLPSFANFKIVKDQLNSSALLYKRIWT